MSDITGFFYAHGIVLTVIAVVWFMRALLHASMNDERRLLLQLVSSIAAAWLLAAVTTGTLLALTSLSTLRQLNFLMILTLLLFPALAFMGYQSIMYRPQYTE